MPKELYNILKKIEGENTKLHKWYSIAGENLS